MGFAGKLVELAAARQNVVLAPGMALVRRHIANRAVPMLTVVPVDEAIDPAL